MKYLMIVFLIVLLMDNIYPFVLGRFYHAYSHKKMLLSELGSAKSPIKWFYNVWCIISGIVFSWAGIFVYTVYENGLSIAIWVLLIAYGIGCEIMSGLFPIGVTKDDNSVSSKLHAIGSVIGFTLLIFAPLLLAINAFVNNDVLYGVISIICFAITFIAFILFIMSDKDKFKNTIISYCGIWQRLSLVFCYIPFIILGLCNYY